VRWFVLKQPLLLRPHGAISSLEFSYFLFGVLVESKNTAKVHLIFLIVALEANDDIKTV